MKTKRVIDQIRSKQEVKRMVEEAKLDMKQIKKSKLADISQYS